MCRFGRDPPLAHPHERGRMDSPHPHVNSPHKTRAVVGAVILFAATFLTGQLAASSKKDSAKQTQHGVAGAPTSSSAKFVGAETCKTCHEDQFKQIAGTPHWNSVLKVNGMEAHSCETCHGPGSEHVDAGG